MSIIEKPRTPDLKGAAEAMKNLGDASARAAEAVSKLNKLIPSEAKNARGPRPTPRPVSLHKRKRRIVAASRRANRA